MIGIGLGGFMDGYQKGRDIRNDKEDRERTKVLQERQDAEYKRVTDQRAQIDQINADAQATFDQKVSAGEVKPDAFDSFYSGYVIPKLKNTYLSQGNIDMADKVQAWGDTADAKRGAKLFSSALMKANTGDSAGALGDIMEMGKLKGYLDHGYEVTGSEDILVDGKLTGHRIKMKMPDGEELVQDIMPGDLPKLIATFGNPEAAWESQNAATTDARKRALELEEYRAKKEIDRQYSVNDKGATRADAIKSLRTRFDGIEGPAFDDMGAEEQETLIRKEQELVSGQVGLAGAGRQATPPEGAPRPGVVMDKVTGKPVQPAPQAAPATVRPDPAPVAREPSPEQQKARADNVAYQVEAAAVALQEGDNPERVRQNLLNNGIPEDLWPEALRKAQPAAAKGERLSPSRDPDQKTGRGGEDAEIIRAAAAELAKGGEVGWLIEDLRSRGIPEERWPVGLRERARSGDQIGLGQ